MYSGRDERHDGDEPEPVVSITVSARGATVAAVSSYTLLLASILVPSCFPLFFFFLGFP